MVNKVALSVLPRRRLEEGMKGVRGRGMLEWMYFMKPEDSPGGYISWEGSEETIFTKATVGKIIRTPGDFSGLILYEPEQLSELAHSLAL